MKNKKLFAILTLVCFMFTLMPVAAFAATISGSQVEVYDAETGKWVEEATVKADTAFNVRVNGVTGSFVYYAVDSDNKGVAISTAIDASSLKIKAEGDYKVNAIYVTDNISKVREVLESLDTVEAKVSKLVKWADAADLIVGGYADVYVQAEKQTYTLTATGANLVDGVLTIAANNGFSKDGIVKITLTNAKGEAVKNAALTVTKAGYVDVASKTLTTDRKGEVELTITSGFANDGNKVIVKYDKAKVEITVNATTKAATKVTVNAEPQAPVNIKNTMYNTGVQFKFVDANGTACAPAAVNVELTSQPANSKLKVDGTFELSTTDAKGNALAKGVYALKAKNTLTKEGAYTVKVSLENGATASATFTAKEMGDTVALMFNPQDTPKTVAYGAKDFNLAGLVLSRDANGVTERSEAILSVSGLAVEKFDGAKLTVKDNRDYIGSTITVLAKDGDFVATTTLTVVDKAATIAYADTAVETGVSKTLVGTIVDASNSASAVDLTGAKVSAIVVEKPSTSAIAVANAQPNNGKINLTFLASEAGAYKVQTIVEFADKSYISAITDITAGGSAVAFKDVVVMSIGAESIVVNSDVKAIAAAPMIQDGRTFVPFRALAEAFGANVAWDEATQSVTAELNGVKVVMKIGEKAYTVNGVAKVADVAPFINGASTMVPVRFVAEAFGINVTPIYAANGSVADVMFAK